MLLLIDNIDSFTHNLARYFVELGESVSVKRNNELTLSDISALNPRYLVFSPGPCTPNQAGITLAAIKTFAGRIPMLGVCLGHQAIGQAFGGKVTQARQILHGKTSEVIHGGKGLFHSVPSPFNATRYHSLVVTPDSLPPSLQIDAWSQTPSGEKEIMAMSHTSFAIWGVQFHPESLLTEHGHKILQNFLFKAKNSKKSR